MTGGGEPLATSWNLEHGSARDLLAAILSARLDEVLVESRDPARFSQLERLGFPLEPAPAGDGDSPFRCKLLPQLSGSMLPVREYAFSVSTEDVRRYGESSGDLNPLHFDDAFARKNGFPGRIAHGMLFNGWFTRLLGVEFPGEGTIYLRNNSIYLAPIYPDQPYTIRVSTPRHDPARGSYRILAQLFSAEGLHAIIAYADVLNRAPRLP